VRRHLPGAEDLRSGLTIAMRAETIVELGDPPVFGPGDKVRSLRGVRNDGTFLGRRIGDHILAAGEIGYVQSIGTFLQQFYIYNVDFVDRGVVVGMRAKELELIAKAPDEDDDA
jgi:nitrogen fixation protein NifZ